MFFFKMDVLPQHFRALWFCGMWSEDEKFYFLRFLYEILVISLAYHISLGQVLQVFVTSNNVQEFTTGLLFTLTFLALCFKIWNFVSRRDDIKKLLNHFREEICKSRLPEEEAILEKYKINNKRIFLIFMIICQTNGVTLLCQPIQNWGKSTELPIQVYYPFNTTDIKIFTAIYVTEFLETIYAIGLNVSLDTMVYGFLHLAAGLFELLCYRLKSTNCKSKNMTLTTIKEWIKFHVLILEIVNSIESFFMGIVIPMFLFTLMVLCSGIFQMTQQSAKLDALTMWLIYYILCMTAQVFVFCWYGSQLDEKSRNVAAAVYETDWTSLAPSEIRSLSLMILIAEKGSIVSNRGLCALTHETFGWIIKSSYAALNVLKRYSNE